MTEEYDSIDCYDTGFIESMSYDAIICEAWDRYGEFLISDIKMREWNNNDYIKIKRYL